MSRGALNVDTRAKTQAGARLDATARQKVLIWHAWDHLA
jgi:hypothetical protein